MDFVLQMMADGKIAVNLPDKAVTTKIPLADTVEKGFRVLLGNAEAHLKILTEPPNWS